MRRILICTSILGGGTALTFTAAAIAATLLPGGTVVPGNSVMWEREFGKPGIVVPMPAIDPEGDIEVEVDRVEVDAGAADGG
jgi:hypothetical protein